MSHGQGSLHYPGNQRIDGVWNRGEVREWRYTFSDGLIYETEGWSYCGFPDRRFNRSKVSGLRPAGRSLKTEDQPTKVIPSGCYDVGDGIFDPETLCVSSFDQPSKIVRIPKPEERRWITQRCRKGGIEPTGYQPWLNENWSSDPPELPYRLAMSKDSPENWWKRVFTFETDASGTLEKRRRAALLQTEGNLERLDASFDLPLDCVCGSEKRSDTEAEDVCGADRRSEESSIEELDILREVICDEIHSSDEYEDEDDEDLLMTVCCPPGGTYTITRRRTSTRTLKSEGDSIHWGEVEEEEGKFKEVTKRIGRREADEEGERQASISEDEQGIIWERNYFRDTGYYNIEESIIGEEDSISYVRMVRGSTSTTGLKPKAQREKRKSTASAVKRTKKTKRKKSKKRPRSAVINKEQLLQQKKKRPCPSVMNKEQLLQQKVGELLFAPALEAPRSPVYLVKKTCDRKRCDKLKTAKQSKVSKCGGPQSPANLPAKNRKHLVASRFCDAGLFGKKKKKKKEEKKKNICISSRLFLTATVTHT